MEIKQVFVKKRSQFGKQCIFDDSEVTVEENIFPNHDSMKDYVRINPVDKAVQISKQFAVHEVKIALIFFQSVKVFKVSLTFTSTPF